MSFYQFSKQIFFLVIFSCIIEDLTATSVNIFPQYFKFGASTSAFQIEGGWNASGKGPTVWDHAIYVLPKTIESFENKIAPDSLYYFKDDIRSLKETKFNFYRFSISWARIMPKGDRSTINYEGVNYYDGLINELLENSIEPVVTMHHFDMPQSLQEIGGWLNDKIIDYFVAYAEFLFEHFGDRIQKWITINEPYIMCLLGYSEGIMPPLIKCPGVCDYMCGHNTLKAHSQVYRLYKSKYAKLYNGKVGIALNSNYFFMANGNENDRSLVERAMQFSLGWFANPIFSENGDYPLVMRKTIDENSKREGRPWSRLPTFSETWRIQIRNSADFLGLNYYSSALVEATEEILWPIPSHEYDLHLEESFDSSWKRYFEDSTFYSVPQGLGHLLRWIKREYNNPEVIITENGFGDLHGNPNDPDRVKYLNDHLIEVSNAVNMHDCNVTGYSVWSLLDNFELADGYRIKFGIFAIEPYTKRRIPKNSAIFLKNVIESRIISNQ